MTIIYKKCLKCGSKNLVSIVYGMPSYELYQEAEAGKVKLGGCVLSLGGPEYICKDCEHEWNREQAIDHAYSKIITIKASVGGYFGGYYDVTIDCGIQWSVEILTEGRSIKKYGDNKFPEEWDLFCRLIRHITKRKFQ